MGVIRKTKSVKAILNEFENQNQALSSVELVERFTNQMNKTTVYRILERLEDDGILHSFKGEDNLQWFAKCHGCNSHKHEDLHPHFQCKTCGKTECLEVNIPVPSLKQHHVEKAEFLLIGQCSECIE